MSVGYGLNVNCELMDLNTWSPVSSRSVWEELGGMALMEQVCS